MIDIPQTHQEPKRTLTQMAMACETAAKRIDRKSMREAEANELVACLIRASDFLRAANANAAGIAMLLGRPVP
jgi:hypothetical protein